MTSSSSARLSSEFVHLAIAGRGRLSGVSTIPVCFDSASYAIAPQSCAGWPVTGIPIQYAHVREPLALWDVWTRIAADPIAFEPPSAGFALDWRTLEAWRGRGVGFATITHAAGISSTGDSTLDRQFPFDEPYIIPQRTAALMRSNPDQGKQKGCFPGGQGFEDGGLRRYSTPRLVSQSWRGGSSSTRWIR